MTTTHDDNEINGYNSTYLGDLKDVCDILQKEFNASLKTATSKLYHRNPAWFLEGNPIVGYYVPAKKQHVTVMFWSGQSFGEPNLEVEGSFKAATVNYASVGDINLDELRRWLEKSKKIQWNYKDIVKNRGHLDMLPEPSAGQTIPAPPASN